MARKIILKQGFVHHRPFFEFFNDAASMYLKSKPLNCKLNHSVTVNFVQHAYRRIKYTSANHDQTFHVANLNRDLTVLKNKLGTDQF